MISFLPATPYSITGLIFTALKNYLKFLFLCLIIEMSVVPLEWNPQKHKDHLTCSPLQYPEQIPETGRCSSC